MTKQNLKITLHVDGEETIYETPEWMSGTLLESALDAIERIETSTIISEEIDDLLQFVCDSFSNQFTISELKEGTDSRKLMQAIYATAFFVTGQETLAFETLEANIDIIAISKQLNE